MKSLIIAILLLTSPLTWALYHLSPKEVEAIHYYTFLGYEQINPALREGRPFGVEAARQFPYLLSGLKKIPVSVGTTYRSEHYQSANELQKIFNQNFYHQYMELKQFWSSTNDQQMTRRFCQTHYCIYYEIHGKSGHDVSALSEINDESEVIFLPGTRFKLLNSRKDGNNLFVTIQEL